MSEKRKPKKLPKILSREDVKKILAVPNTKTITGLRNRVILQILYRAGLRVEEVCNLAPADVDLSGGFILVQQGKGHKDGTIPIDAETIQWLKKWMEKRIPGPYLFVSHRGKKLDQSYIRKVCYQCSEKSGVYIQDGKNRVPIHPHVLRHCYATELLEEGYTLAEVQRLLRHSNISVTSIYLSVRPVDLAAKIRGRETA